MKGRSIVVYEESYPKNKELWLLVTSLAEAQLNAPIIANSDRQRMRIEENIRDTKCSHYGLGLKHSLIQSAL